MFSREFHRHLAALPRARRERISARVKYVQRANVVLHSTFRETPRSVHTSTLLGCRPDPRRLPTRPKIAMLASNEPNSPFSHLRLHTKRHGKLLLFTTGNVIRAGKHTHADGAWAVLALRRWAMRGDGHHSLLWPTAMSTPNAVCNGQFTAPMGKGIYSHWRATHTSKFPGIAVTFPNASNTVAEIFTKAWKWIVPGVKCAQQLVAALDGLAELHDEITCDSDTGGTQTPLPAG